MSNETWGILGQAPHDVRRFQQRRLVRAYRRHRRVVEDQAHIAWAENLVRAK